MRGRLAAWLIAAMTLALALVAPAAASGREIGPFFTCVSTSRPCTVLAVNELDPQGRLLRVSAPVVLDPAEAARPFAVFISAFASSQVYWDGIPIGGNGRPDARPELERAGDRDAVIPVPARLATVGRHILTVEMSSGLGWVRLESPVRSIGVGPFEDALAPGLRAYLPALGTLGGLIAAIAYFAFAARRGRAVAAAWLAGAALCAAAQLCAEVSRAVIPYAYPTDIVRLILILACASGFGLMLVAYAARRFAAPRPFIYLFGQVAASLAAILASGGFDQKTISALMIAAAIGLVLALDGLKRRVPGAALHALLFGMALTGGLTYPSNFLDRGFYIWAASLFLALFIDEARRPAPETEEAPAGATQAGSPELVLGTPGHRYFVLASDIVRLAAADDYSEVFLADGRALLHAESLGRLLERLPGGFLRVHRSHAINLAHLSAFRKGRRSVVLLSDRSSAPVSRRSVGRLVSALGASG